VLIRDAYSLQEPEHGAARERVHRVRLYRLRSRIFCRPYGSKPFLPGPDTGSMNIGNSVDCLGLRVWTRASCRAR
jgi:hypothetical protein